MGLAEGVGVLLGMSGCAGSAQQDWQGLARLEIGPGSPALPSLPV